MTHEGRMLRGEEKLSKGIKDIETEYFLANKPKPIVKEVIIKEKPKEVKKNVKSNK